MITLTGIGSFNFQALAFGETKDITSPVIMINSTSNVQKRKVDEDWIVRTIFKGVMHFRICDDLWSSLITFVTANNGRPINYKRYKDSLLVEEYDGIFAIEDLSEERSIYAVSFRLECDS